MLEEGLRSAEMLGDYFCHVRFANTRAWLLSELLDHEAALGQNLDVIRIAEQSGDSEAGSHAHINLAHDYLILGEHTRAFEHLNSAEDLYTRDTWFRWVSYPRLQAEWCSYWVARGDLTRALSSARLSLEHAGRTRIFKRMAWAYKLMGDIAVLEDRIVESRRQFGAALELLTSHRCPTIEWQIARAAARAAGLAGDHAASADLIGRARAVVGSLAGSIGDNKRRDAFLSARLIRELA
jgi:tetratricopeptide (TPR) repeat protein